MQVDRIKTAWADPVDRAMAFLVTTAVLYYSYTPFLYIFDYTGLGKAVGYVALMLSCVVLLLVRVAGVKNVNFHYAIIILLYCLFATYALLRFSLSRNIIGDFYNIRTIVVINVVFTCLALYCSRLKAEVLGILFAYSSVYLGFTIYSLLTGGLSLGGKGAVSIFSGFETLDNWYQNLNTYLGLFIILAVSWGLGFFKPFWIRLLLTLLAITAGISMLVVGGRAGVIGLLAALGAYGFSARRAILSNRRFLRAFAATIAISIILVVLNLNSISAYLEDFTTYRRFLSLAESNDPSQRLFLFKKAVDLFTGSWHNVLFGGGVNSFPVYIERFGATWYPHNITLELLSEYGLTGYMLFIMPVLYTLYHRKCRLGSIFGNDENERTAFLLFIYYWTIFTFSSGMRFSWTVVFFTYLIFPRIPTAEITTARSDAR